ncbi:uncharacterized protein F4812DRAFT_431399 [Daldinia caldariorum]|uniref:uncharacterized protein n=1 Tax=Daldinia caldariorum TaxID=326644 RepID=UPI002008CAB6|nr:uncharacterized protein F4812DRAFT_431399 [Daldinia caldariorum]KAI1467149.1 hypothetical protein F4812DRAFT_431399 [Daldinia caldariorum]
MAGDGPSAEAHAGEILSCVSCRNRKLKCDRTKPRCNRCEKAKLECVFPESRRKPAFKRRNVRELEARLAQVEVLLRETNQNRSQGQEAVQPINDQAAELSETENILFQGIDFTDSMPSLDDGNAFAFQQEPAITHSTANLDNNHGQDNTPFTGDLIGLGGIFESLPPFDMMEDLNRIFFERQGHLIPIIHPSRYLQAFYSAPHMKPPMCLQYAIWALAAHGNPKYGACSDVFYRRARQYAELDEMKGYGEHFITVAHAQAWCVIATYEAKLLLFTRAAMSGSRGVRLVQMMGLHRLDGSAEEICPTLVPPRDWIELEERRRVFWGIFCVDSHCSISTGWPFLIDSSEITTLLPAPEHAFLSGEEVETCSIQEALKGKTYSSFSGAVLVCHIFNQILKHIHRPKSTDNPDNYEYGEYWQRHRELDNTLSSAFMYLPASFRLPDNYRDPVAVHTNLNLHASTICLHHAAIEMIEAHKLPESAKKICHDRLSTAAQEIVNIVRLTSHVNSSPKSPLAALSLYCAASVYVYLCQETQTPTNVDNLDFVIAAMQAFGKNHSITRAFLRQVVIDIERNGIQDIVGLASLDNLGPEFRTQITHNIPLLARSKISRHSQVQPPLPGRLPLGKPMGEMIVEDSMDCEHGTWVSDVNENELSLTEARSSNYMNYMKNNKRKRVAPSHGTSTLDSLSESCDSPWVTNIQDRISTNPSTHSSPEDPVSVGTSAYPTLYPSGPGMAFQGPGQDLPHRTNSPRTNASSHLTASQTHSNSGLYPVSRWNLTGMYTENNGRPLQGEASPCNLSANNDHIPWFITSENVSVDWGGAKLNLDPDVTLPG